MVLARTVFRYSHGFYLFPVLARILPFFGTLTYSTLFRYSPRQFFDTRTDSTFFHYSPRYYHFSVLTLIRPFFGTCRDRFSILARILPFSVLAWSVFQYSHGFYLFPVPARILPFFGTHTDSTLFRYSPRLFFDTRTDCTFSGHRRNFFSILTGIFLCPIISRILPFFGTHTDSTIFRYSPGQFFGTHRGSTFSWYSLGFYHFSLLAGSVFRYSYGFYIFPVLAHILPFFGTHTDSTLFRYS